jgi:opacity protein-like surface antigen
MIMIYRTLAASVLALGLLSPAAFAASNDCNEVNNRISDYGSCSADTASTASNAFAATAVDVGNAGPVGDYVDETPAESNQRSNNR